MLTVHLRVNDAATGRPTPVRLQITGPDGTQYAPFGRTAEFPVGRNEAVGGHLRLGRDRFCYIDGTCEVKLPAGVPLRVQATKGPEYTPLNEMLTLGSGQMALRFAVSRWSDVRADGWHPGDVRAHFLDPHTARLEAAAEDVDVVNLLACRQLVPSQDGQLYPCVPLMTAFSGQSPALEGDGRLVAVNTLNTHPVLGRVGLLHSHRPVFPLTFGGEDTDDWSVCDWCDQCHRKGGLAVWVRAFEPEAGLVGGEALIALALGKIDAVEFDAHPRTQPILPWWYRLLNAGFRVPLVGGSGKDSNRIPLGAPRTYARLGPGEGLTYKAWIEAVRAGRVFATNGPMLGFEVNGRRPGETVELTEAGRVAVRASARCVSPFDRLEIVGGGQVVAHAAARQEQRRWGVEIAEELPFAESGWLAARCVGGAGSYLNPEQLALAHSAPVFVRVAGRPLPQREAAGRPLRVAVSQTREWIEAHGRFTDERRKRHLLDLCDAALARLTPATAEGPTA